jgi:hypothetical protein
MDAMNFQTDTQSLRKLNAAAQLRNSHFRW